MSPPDSPYPAAHAVSTEQEFRAQLKAIREASEAGARRISRVEHALADLTDAVTRGTTSSVPPSLAGTRALPPHRERQQTHPEDSWAEQSSRIELPPQQLVADVLDARELDQRREAEKARREFRAKIVQGVITTVAAGVIVAEIVKWLGHH